MNSEDAVAMKEKSIRNHVPSASTARKRKSLPCEKTRESGRHGDSASIAKHGSGKPNAEFADLKQVLEMIEERWPRA